LERTWKETILIGTFSKFAWRDPGKIWGKLLFGVPVEIRIGDLPDMGFEHYIKPALSE
jgi:hypothetical protein